jgi:hypothetical protein
MKKDLIGQRFGRLVVVEKLPSKNKKRWWRCKCDCGNLKDVPTNRLTTGGTRSCGCLAKEVQRKHAEEIREKAREVTTKHGLSTHRIHNVWGKMIYRCENPKSSNFKHYGGKGIKVCEEWHDLRKFYEWAINNGYKDNLEIDRIDNSKDYCPENCRWATRKQQTRNTSQNTHVEINGERMILVEVAEKYGIKYSTVRARYRRGERGEELIRKVDLENCNQNKRITSNTGIRGISKRKTGYYVVSVTRKKKTYSASVKTLEEAIKKKEEFLNQLNKE